MRVSRACVLVLIAYARISSVGDSFGDIDRGIYLVRGENVVLLGEIVSMTISIFF